MAGIHLEEDIRPLSEFRANTADLIQRVRSSGRPLVLTQRGHSAAVVMGVSEYQRLIEELELLRDIQTALHELEAGKGIPHSAAIERCISNRKSGRKKSRQVRFQDEAA